MVVFEPARLIVTIFPLMGPCVGTVDTHLYPVPASHFWLAAHVAGHLGPLATQRPLRQLLPLGQAGEHFGAERFFLQTPPRRLSQ